MDMRFEVLGVPVADVDRVDSREGHDHIASTDFRLAQAAGSELGDTASTTYEQPSPEHQRPEGLDDLTVEAVGLLSEALERTERARGHLYAFHQLTGGADFKVGDAVDALHKAGHDEIADRIATELVGRNVLQDRWTFQIVEDYDDNYWGPFREIEREVRERLTAGRRHLYEAELKEARRTHGHPDHTARPPE